MLEEKAIYWPDAGSGAQSIMPVRLTLLNPEAGFDAAVASTAYMGVEFQLDISQAKGADGNALNGDVSVRVHREVILPNQLYRFSISGTINWIKLEIINETSYIMLDITALCNLWMENIC